MTQQTSDALDDEHREGPFDRTGLLCLAWAGAFFLLTALLSIALR